MTVHMDAATSPTTDALNHPDVVPTAGNGGI
jgi:hypothetical protein